MDDITDVLDAIRSRLARKRRVFQRCADMDSMPTQKYRDKADAMWEAIAMVDRFRKHYSQE